MNSARERNLNSLISQGQEYLLYAKNLCWASVLYVEYRRDEMKLLTTRIHNSVAAIKHTQRTILRNMSKPQRNENTLIKNLCG